MRWEGAVFAALVASACIGSVSRDAAAQPVVGKEIARRLFEEGVELERRGEYTAALAKFDDAAKIVQTPGIRFHQGYAHEMRGELTASLDAYEAALRLAREQSKSEVESATLGRLEPLRARVPRLAVRLSTPAEVKVQLDRQDLSPSLLDGKAFRVDPGEHVLTAEAPGYRPFRREVRAREGQSSTVEIALDRAFAGDGAKAQDSSAPEVGPPRETRPRSLAAPILVTTGAVALAATGVVGFIAAGSAQRDAEASCPSVPDCSDERTTVRTLDLVSLVGFVGGAGLGVLAAVLWTSGSKPSSAHGGPRPNAVTGELFTGPGTAGLRGVFW